MEHGTGVGSVPVVMDDLPGFYERVSDVTGTDHTYRMRRIVSAPDAWTALPEVIRDTAIEVERILVVEDGTEILRDGAPLKPAVAELLAGGDVPVEVLVLADDEELHTSDEHIATVRAELRQATAVLALGSGTIADITKHAVFAFEQEHPQSPLHLVSLQTANSVCAFTSELAVVTTDGVKRTVPSRLPDILVLDTTVLREAPRTYTFGGIGDASVAAVSLADYRLASLQGMGRWEPAAALVLDDVREDFLAGDPRLADEGEQGAEAIARALGACGFAMSMAGESAPVSGLEHITSHMLDMLAVHRTRPIGNHGMQCGIASALVLIAFKHLVNEVDVGAVDAAALTFDLERERADVMATFAEIDPSGAAGEECWRDYATKLDAWGRAQPAVAAFVEDWPQHREVLRQHLCEPGDFMSALHATGHPLHFEEIPPGLSFEEVRWAFANARKMRKRWSVADLLYVLGVWDEAFVDEVFATFFALRNEIR